MKYYLYTFLFIPIVFLLSVNTPVQAQKKQDTTIIFAPSDPELIHAQNYRPLTNAWGLDLLMSNNGVGFGVFYRHEFSEELSWMLNFVISDVKDETEFERFDYYGESFIPGKKNRLLLMPLMFSMQYRLFKDDIVDNFRPFVTAGLGPTMVYVSPYTTGKIYYDFFGEPYKEKLDFFTSLKYGRPRYTIGGFIGIGAYFGMDKGEMYGINIKYFFAPFPDGIEVMENGYIKNISGLFIILTFGSLF